MNSMTLARQRAPTGAGHAPLDKAPDQVPSELAATGCRGYDWRQRETGNVRSDKEWGHVGIGEKIMCSV